MRLSKKSSWTCRRVSDARMLPFFVSIICPLLPRLTEDYIKIIKRKKRRKF